MREILFRGKCVQTDEWIKGSLIIDENNRYYIGRAVTPKVPVSFGVMPSRQNGKTRERFIGIGFVMVYPETVGEFTGLTDKNGKPVFEGDIVKGLFLHMRSVNGVVIFQDGAFGLEWMRGDIHEYTPFTSMWDVKYEIIGNVHDNPGLLKGADDESV
jgi:hypothetical protein